MEYKTGARVRSLIDHVPDTPLTAWVLEGDIGDVIGPGSEPDAKARLTVRFANGVINILKTQVELVICDVK